MTELKKFDGSARFRNTVAEVQKTRVGHEEAQKGLRNHHSEGGFIDTEKEKYYLCLSEKFWGGYGGKLGEVD